MGARDKRNAVVVGACLIVSALLGLVMGSWGAFRGILVVTTVGCYAAGGIRTHPGDRRHIARRGGGGRRHPTRGRRS